MKKATLFSLVGTALVGLAQPLLAVPHGEGRFAGGGHPSSRQSGGIRAAPALSAAGARLSGGRSLGGLSRAPQQFSYYNGSRMPLLTPHASSRQPANRPITSTAGRIAAVNRQPNRVNSVAGQKQVSAPQRSIAKSRQSFMKNHAFARHDGTWHNDWNKHRAHFDHGHVFVFIDGFWWGLYPLDYYSYYYGDGYYPYDYSYDYGDYPYDGYDHYDSSAYSYYSGYAPAGQYSNTVVSAVQSKLSSLGYYHGAIDGILGDESEAALARYQQDQDLSVTGTVTTATLSALGLPYSAGL